MSRTSTCPEENPPFASYSWASATSKTYTESPPASVGIRIHSAITGSSADLQTVRYGLLRHSENALERYHTLPFRLFYWESPDGSKVLTYFPTDYVHDNVNPTREAADFAESAQRNPGTTEMLDLYGIGDHGGGPTRAMLDQADTWIAAGKKGTDAIPTMRYHTAQQYFTDVETHLNPDSPTWNYDSIAKGYTAPPAGPGASLGIPTWNSELYFEYHRGIFTTQAAHKNNLRRSEAATLDTEKISSLAWLNGASYPARQLNENWKKITFNGFTISPPAPASASSIGCARRLR